MEKKKAKVVVVMVALPAQGHLNQLLHLAHLIASYGVPVHYAGSTSHNRQAKLRHHGWDHQTFTNIHFHDFELPPYDSPSPSPNAVGHFTFPHNLQPLFEASTHLRQPIYSLLQQLSQNFGRVVVIHDLMMSYVVQDVKLLPNSEAYTFDATSAFTHFSNLWEIIPKENKPFQLHTNDIPACTPPFEGCMASDMKEFATNQYNLLGFQSGWISDTSRAIEGRYVELLEKLSSNNGEIKQFALGPFIPVHINTKTKSKEKRHECLEWLDEKEKNSVIYVSFGSTVSMRDDQIEELANGLEKSGEKFIWVVRTGDPNDIFEEGKEVKRPQIPIGFEERVRVRGRGLVVRDWAPQLEILGHPSVGGFMSHCGWNSCLESMSMGVPIAAWPMHSDQPKNATLLCEVLKIGMLVREWEHHNKIVISDKVKVVLKTLMGSEKGNEMRKRAAKLSEDIRVAVAEGGVTHSERDAFIAHISR